MLKRIGYYLRSIPTLLLGIQNWWAIFLLLFGQSETTIKLRSGLQFKVRSVMDVWIIKETCLDRDYEVHGVPLESGWTIIDIGAGLGDFTLFAAADSANRVFGFEPFAESYGLLQQNMAINGVQNVTAVSKAVGKENGTIQLATAGAAVQHSTSMEEAPQEASLLTVEALTLESLFLNYGIPHCHFLKMDCEGGEFDILLYTTDETLDKIDHICMEYHDHVTAHTHLDLVRFLAAKGFEVQTMPNPVHDYLGFLYAKRGGL
jgi:FkbM family methyltransferase